MLNPCHYSLLFSSILLALPVNRATAFLAGVYRTMVVGVVFAILADDVASVGTLGAWLYRVEHWLAFPFNYVLLKRREGATLFSWG
jgi:hypothetical protein